MRIVSTRTIGKYKILSFIYICMPFFLCFHENCIAGLLLIDTNNDSAISRTIPINPDKEYDKIIVSDDTIIAFVFGHDNNMIVNKTNIISGESEQSIIQFKKVQDTNWWYRTSRFLKDNISLLSRFFPDNDGGLYLSNTCIPYYIAYTDNLITYSIYDIFSNKLSTINTQTAMTPVGLLNKSMYLFIQTSEIRRRSDISSDKYVIYDLENDSNLSSTVVEYSSDSFLAQYATNLSLDKNYFALIGIDVDSMRLVIYLFQAYPLTLLDSTTISRNDVRKTSAYIDLKDKCKLHLCVDVQPYFYFWEINRDTNKFGSILPNNEMEGIISGNANTNILNSKYYTAWINMDDEPVFHCLNKATESHKQFDLTEYGFNSTMPLSYYLEESSGKVVIWGK